MNHPEHTEKSTTELLHDLNAAESFGQFSDTHQGSFLPEDGGSSGLPEKVDSVSGSQCPHCGAALPENSFFCPACMQVLSPRRILTPKKAPLSHLTRLLIIFGSALFAAILLGIVLFAILQPKRNLTLPTAEEFRDLACGASDEMTRTLWTPEALTLLEANDLYSVYEAGTSFSAEPALTVFEGGKRLLFALGGFPRSSYEDACRIAEAVFAAVYRYYPEDLSSLLSEQSQHWESGTEGPALSGLDRFGLASSPADFEHLTLQTDRFSATTEVYRRLSADDCQLILIFSEDAS